MEKKNSEEFPRLELTFADDGGHPFLVDACFRLDGSLPASRKFVEQPPRGKSFRALCILMLLAKYRGENPGGDENISFFAGADRPTWIKTLGTSFGRLVQQEFFQKYFHNRKFLSASRGSGHTQENRKAGGGVQPCAKYHTPQLRLHNLQFFKRPRNALAKPTAMTEDDVAMFAEKLEKHEVGKGEGWEAIVPEIVAKTKQDRPLKPGKATETASAESDDVAVPFILSARWRDLGNAVRKEIEGRVRGGSWYIVCVTPSWLLDWKGIFFDAVVRHNAKMKFAYHSPSTVGSCLSVKAQWRMNIGYVDTNAPVEYVRLRLKSLKLELGSWAAEMRNKSLEHGRHKGSFEFYESQIAHPFMAILSVPPSKTKSSKPALKAPVGTWCMLLLYPFYPATLDERCGLYLHRPSPMLDIYYHSILTFFEQGPKDGYLKPVDLLRSPSGKIA